jgi:uncharacterized protein YaaN involved in tellurite resistance
MEVQKTVAEADELTSLSTTEESAVQSLVTQIDINDPTLSISWGAKSMAGIAQFSDTLLQHIRAKDAGMVGDQLTDLLVKVKSVDLSAFEGQKGFMESLPLIGKLFNKIERAMLEYQTLAQQVEGVSKKLEQTMIALLRDVATLEQLFIRNHEYLQQIGLYIAAGKKKVEHIRAVDLVSADAMDAQSVTDLNDRLNRFERRLHDLQLSRTIALQTAPQIRLIQNNDHSLAEKIQSSILSTIPIWKSQIVLAVALNTQKNAAKLQKEVADTTNDMLRRNAELLQSGSIEVAREVERSIVDIETLREVQERLLNTIESTVAIVGESRERRISVEQELAKMESDMKTRLATVASGQA